MNKHLEELFEAVDSQFPDWESMNDGELAEAILKAKPFHGYNKKRHARSGGLNAKFREKYNRETGSNLKAPVTESNPKGKRAARRKSFCARMSGVKGPTSKDGKLTPKGAALKRWKCSKALEIYDQLSDEARDFLSKSEFAQTKFKDALEKAGRCWEGYEPTPGKKPYSDGSCRPKTKKSVTPKEFAKVKKMLKNG